VNIETKEQSKQWVHTYLLNKPKKFKQILFACKEADSNSFLEQDRSSYGVIYATKDHNNARITLRNTKKLYRAIQNKRRGMLTTGAVLFHDNARPHTAVCTPALLEHFNWELFDHPHYSPDLAPSDYACLPT
jgi:histone-lysine N-methyltransferase SETMAR